MNDTRSVQLYGMLRRLGRQMHRFYRNMAHEHGLYRGQSHLLKVIGRNDGIIQKDLARLVDMRPPSVTEAVGRLEGLGYIRREADRGDQRMMHVFLTEQGKSILDDVAAHERDFADTLFARLSDDDRESMLMLTTRLCETLDSADRERARSAGAAH